MSDESKVKINLRGTVFKTGSAKFKLFPDSRLANLSTTDKNFDASKNEFYFDRNPALFHFILDLYNVGELHLPKNVCSTFIKEELKFWKLKKESLCRCCIRTFYQDDDDIRIFREYENIQDVFSVCHKHLTRGKIDPQSQRDVGKRGLIWFMISNPLSSKLAKTYFTTVLLSILTSLLVLALSSLESCRTPRSFQIKTASNITSPILRMYLSTRQYHVLAVLDMIANTILLLDYVLVIYSCPKRKVVLLNKFFIMEVISFLYVYCSDFLDQTDYITYIGTNGLLVLACMIGIVCTFRIIRVLRLFRYNKSWIAMYMTLKSSSSVIIFFSFGFFFTSLLAASLVYYAELWSVNSFSNLFVSVWWAVVTLSGVGYGDLIPKTIVGQVITVVVVISGLLLLAIPVVIMTNNYGNYYSCYENLRRHDDIDEEFYDETNRN